MSTLYVDTINEKTSSNGVQIPGHVLQVVQSTITSIPSTTSTSFVDTGLSVTITPTSSSSKILVMADYGKGSSNGTNGMITQLVRGSTSLFYRGDSYSSAGGVYGAGSFCHLDAPATTSAVTYKIQYLTQGSATTVYFNASYGGYVSPTAHLTAMEIAQ
jgi:hypothetical protein